MKYHHFSFFTIHFSLFKGWLRAMQQWVVTTEDKTDDIRCIYFFCSDPHTIESINDQVHSCIQSVSSTEELPVSCDNLFYRVFGIEHIKQFSPSGSLNLRFVLLIHIIWDDDVEFLIEDQSLLHIYVLKESEICLTLWLKDWVFYRVYICPDVIEIIWKIQKSIADKDLDRIFQSVQKFLILFKNDLLFITIFEIKIYPIDPEDSSKSSIFHDDGIIPDFWDRQHRLCIEEIFAFRLLDLVFVS